MNVEKAKTALDREEWNKLYAQQIVDRAGWSMADALDHAQLESKENFLEMRHDPQDCADEEMSNWSE